MTARGENEFDPWAASIEEVGEQARAWQKVASPDLANPGARAEYVTYLIEVLQARAALEGADRQRKAIEAQTVATDKLVKWTWLLALATIALAIAAMVALFLA